MKEAKEYWEGLSIKQQDHFLKDHKSEFNRSSWLSWLGKDFDKLPANVQKVISKHVEEGIYKSGGSFSDFLAKAKTKAKSAYSSTKKGAKELSVKAKDTYSKTEKAVKDKVKEQKRKIAVDVLNDTDNKVKTKEEHIYLDRARQIVVDKYAKGSTITQKVYLLKNYGYRGKRGDEIIVTKFDEKLSLVYGRPKGSSEEYEYEQRDVSFAPVLNSKYAKGTNIKKVDLFEYPEMIPNNVQKVLDHYSESFEDGDYAGLQEAEEELSYIGYTFEYGLDGQAYALRPIGVRVEELEGYEEYCCGGQMYRTGGNMTKYVFVNVVQGNYGYGWEDLTTHDTRLEAKKEMKVYDENERYAHRVITRRVLRTDYEKGNYAKGSNIDKENYDLNYLFSELSKIYTNRDSETYKELRAIKFKANKEVDFWDLVWAIGTDLQEKTQNKFQVKEEDGFYTWANPLAEQICEELANMLLKKEGISLEQSEDEYATGGQFEHENREMVLNNNKQIAHHTKELAEAVKDKHVPAWVVAKVNRSASDLSDATHYMEGQSEQYAKGTNVSSDWTKELTNDENELACSIMNRIVKPGPYVDCNNLKYANKKELKKAIEKNMNMLSAEGKKIATSLLSKLN